MEVFHNPKKDIQKIKEVNISVPFATIPYDVRKSTIAMFIAEVLYKTLKEEEENTELFNYLFNSIQFFDLASNGVANYHLLFLLNLTKYLGFFPKNNYSCEKSFFDLQKGCFVAASPLHPYFLSGELAVEFSQLLKFTFDDIAKIRINYKVRAFLLEKIIEYYHLHIESLGKIKSFSVLKEVFD